MLELHRHALGLVVLEILRRPAGLQQIHALFDVHCSSLDRGPADYRRSPLRYIGAMDDVQTLRRILRENRVVAMVGLSADWFRPSYFAAKYLQEHGYRVIPVNPRYAGKQVLGETCYRTLREIPFEVDVVDVFRRTEDVAPIADDALAIGAKVLWQQIGVKNEASAAKAQAAGLDTVMDRCMKIEHGRLFGGLNWMGVNTRVISAKRPR